MRILEIENQLRQVLPLFIGGFNESQTAVSAVVASGVMTINKTSHGISTGDSVRLSGIEFTLNISLDSFINDSFNVQAILKSVESNDITTGVPETITISGADDPDAWTVRNNV